MEIILLLVLQLAATGAGFALMWRRMGALQQEVQHLRRALEERRGAARPKIVAAAGAASRGASEDAPLARAARAWRKPEPGRADTKESSGETGKALLLAVLAVIPVIAFFLRVEAFLIVACGMIVGAGMMLAALRPAWRVGAWAGVLTASVWALVGLVLPAVQSHPITYAIALTIAALCGLAYSQFARAAPGAVMALAMSAAAVAVGVQVGMIGPAGIAFGIIAASAALIGAARLRLEPIHFAAFGAALIGLFVLSGQSAAAIWFTPAAAWTGALFLAIAAVRVPQLGARGAALAGTGALAPLAAVAALYGAQHGLANRFAAGGAFLALALLLAGIVALAASRRDSGVEGLKLTAWVLATGAFASLTAAIAVTASPPLAALALMGAALGLIALDARWCGGLWRTLACACAVLACIYAWISVTGVLTEAAPGWQSLALAFAAPAALAGLAALLTQRQSNSLTGGALESAAFGLALVGANLAVRLAFSASAPLIQAVGVAETGAHVCVWLAGALMIGARAGAVHKNAAALLWLAALGASVAMGGLWLSLHGRAPAAAFSAFNALSVGAPALLFAAHWAFWRGRDADLITRLSLGAGALLAASALSIEVLKARAATEGADWVSVLACATAFALATALNFAPGIVNTAPAWRAAVPLRVAADERRRARV